MSIPAKFADFIKGLPKAEHHLHIEGACPWHIMTKTDPEQFVAPPVSWADNYRFQTFDDFEQMIFKYVIPWMTTPERYAETVTELLKVRQAENVRYMEFSFAGIALELTGLQARDIAQAIKEAARGEVEVRLFIGLHHAGFSKDHDHHLSEILDTPEIDGIDLHGPEEFPLQDWSKEFWKAASDVGKTLKAHAGELSDANAVREVIEDLGVTKVQHGINAIHDEDILQLAIDAQASFDICPISNVKLRNVSEMSAHPLLELEDAGIACTLNTDDPFIFGNTLSDEYIAVAQGLNATPKQIAHFAKNSFLTADLPEAEIQSNIDEIEELLANY